MSEIYRDEIIQHIIRTSLYIQILRMIQAQPLWGYEIKKRMDAIFHIKLRHGALYPMLSLLERNGFLTSQKQTTNGRARKVYSITKKGKDYLQNYYEVLKEQIDGLDLKSFSGKTSTDTTCT